ncbi:hypothetical protein MC885_002668 [Smutsia gigantea]|nr:hypothetical protein MC885_002668 [Smutsia gigantea]
MSGEEAFYLFKNISLVGLWRGCQYHDVPVWALHLQAAFMGFVFFVGTPVDATVLVATLCYKSCLVAFLAFEWCYVVIFNSLGNFCFSSKHAPMVVLATWTIGIGISIPPFFG